MSVHLVKRVNGGNSPTEQYQLLLRIYITRNTKLHFFTWNMNTFEKSDAPFGIALILDTVTFNGIVQPKMMSLFTYMRVVPHLYAIFFFVEHGSSNTISWEFVTF